LAAEERPLRQLTPIRLHLGAARLSARIVVLDRDQFLPGDEAPAQVTLDRSIGTLHGDRFVPRSFGAADDRWENGARFLAAAPRPQTAQRLLALASPADPDPRQALFAAPFR
jgi:selenocysteine-specific elongation factor